MDPSALGRFLRESRESKELTVEDAVNALKIRRPIIEAFEQGDFSVSETSVQVRGLLRNYARFLDLEEERVLQYYEAAMNPKRRRGRFGRRKKREAELVAPRHITDTPPSLPAVPETATRPRRERTTRRNNMLRNTFWALGAIAAIAFIVYVALSTVQFLPTTTTAESDAVPTIEALNTTTEIVTLIPTSTVIEPTGATLDFAAQGFVGLSIRMEMTQRAWVRIVADNVEQLAEVLEPDEVVEFVANSNVEITTANAIAVRLTVNGLEQPTFGRRGQQATVNITTDGISITLEGEPSATPSPTTVLPTNTPIVTATAVQVNSIGQTQEESAAVTTLPTTPLPTLTSLFSDPASPIADSATLTPLPETRSSDTQANATTSVNTANETTVTQVPPTESGAVLPLRSTPANPTPTKSG